MMLLTNKIPRLHRGPQISTNNLPKPSEKTRSNSLKVGEKKRKRYWEEQFSK